MAFASTKVHPVRSVTSQSPLIRGSVNRNAIRTRLPCGCASHGHTCRKHAVNTVRAGCQGSGLDGAQATAHAVTPITHVGRSVNGRVFAPAVRRARRAAPVQVVRASSAAGEVEESAQGFLGDKAQQKTAYGLLAVVWGAVALAKIFATQQFFDHVFSIANPPVGLLGLQRLAGFSSLAPAVAAYTLVKAAKGGRLDDNTYLRQNLGLAVAGVMTLFYLWKTPANVLEPFYQKLAAGLATLTAVVGGAVYSQYSGHKFNVAKIAEGFGNSVAALFSPDNTNAAMYSILSAGLGIYSLVLLFGPHELAAQWLVIGSGDVSLYLQREIGLSTFLAAIQTYCLKDAADQNKMDQPAFKSLNLSLAAIAAGNASALWWAVNAAKLASWTTQSYARLVFLAVQVVTYAYNWIESDRDESEDLAKLKGAGAALTGEKGFDTQTKLSPRLSPRADTAFDTSGLTTRNVVEFSEANHHFQSGFHSGDLPAPPARKIAVVTCMDARLHPEAFLGLRFGDAHMIRNAGGRISDDALRSLVISQRFLGTEEIVVIHHTECGMMTLENEAVYQKVGERLGPEAAQHIHGKDFMPLGTDLQASVKRDVKTVREYKAIPDETPVHGFIYDVKKGALIPVN